MRNFTKNTIAIAILCCSAIGGPLLGQGGSAKVDRDIVSSQIGPIVRQGVANMSAQSEDDWDPYFKTVVKIHEPGIDSRKDQVRAEKAVANALKAKLEASGELWGENQNKTSASWAPTLGTNFFGNSFGGGDPADNALAVSAGGMMISGNNSRFHSYDSTGTQMSSQAFTQFSSAGGVNTGFTYDPKCAYDANADRFAVCFLSGASPSNSKVIVAFSQTNDPSGSWNVYSIPGNVNSLGVWTDFVQIGFSEDEFFVTGNPFTSAGASRGAAVWQIDKANGYAGTALNPVLHYVANGFSLHPVQGGSTLYGPKMYFLESTLSSASSVNLYELTNTISGGGVLNSPVSFNMGTGYSIPPDATQRSVGIKLKTNDTRVQSSYYENGRIEFVLNTGSGGKAGIYHGTGVISPFLLSFSSFTAEVLTMPDYDIAYASIAYAGQQDASGFNHSYIGFNTTGPAHFPGIAAVYVDEQGYSPMVIVKEGVSYINSADNRWGDYADIEERIGHPGEAWVVGTMGNSSNQQRTYIGQLLPPVPVAVAAPVENAAKLEVFPNPSTEKVVFEFPVDEAGEYKVFIRDMQGRTVKLLIENWLQKGTAKLAFLTSHLPAGTYIVAVESDAKQLFTEKMVVRH